MNKPQIKSIGAGSVTVSGLTREDEELFQGLINGHQRLSVVDGKLVATAVHEPLPDPTTDEEMAPFWRRCAPNEGILQEELFDRENYQNSLSPSILIQSLCGYGYTPEAYRNQSERLKGYGFAQLRSQRSPSGQYYEIWYLAGLYLAQGGLAEAVAKFKSNNMNLKDTQEYARRSFKAATDFLAANVRFGTLDVSVQRWAMCMSD